MSQQSAPQSVEVRVTSIDLPFADLLLLSFKLIAVQVVLSLIVGAILLAVGVL